eukprot:TRINITY_DN682_c0_g1_i1.p1 TRINITY_DN682_c0_g1~~TRINITY_DN682_c0_g1_i1.p1  ORF type:complete len:139 (+),score=22.48 TRINITY_DN682_c0_g1_i1:108-524(+)
MDIFVKTLTGKTITVEVQPYEDVYQIQQIIHEREGIPPSQQRLVFAGKSLLQTNTIKSYGIQKESTIHMTLMLRSVNGRRDMDVLEYACDSCDRTINKGEYRFRCLDCDTPFDLCRDCESTKCVEHEGGSHSFVKLSI